MKETHRLVRDDLKLQDDGGEIPKSPWKGWRFDSPAVKSPLHLTENLPGDQLPPVLWRWHINLLSSEKEYKKKKKENRPNNTHIPYPRVLGAKELAPILSKPEATTFAVIEVVPSKFKERTEGQWCERRSPWNLVGLHTVPMSQTHGSASVNEPSTVTEDPSQSHKLKDLSLSLSLQICMYCVCNE